MTVPFQYKALAVLFPTQAPPLKILPEGFCSTVRIELELWQLSSRPYRPVGGLPEDRLFTDQGERTFIEESETVSGSSKKGRFLVHHLAGLTVTWGSCGHVHFHPAHWWTAAPALRYLPLALG